jgi:hypothetical protein
MPKISIDVVSQVNSQAVNKGVSPSDALVIFQKICEAFDLLGDLLEKIEVVTVGCFSHGMLAGDNLRFKIVFFDYDRGNRVKFEMEFSLPFDDYKKTPDLIVSNLVDLATGAAIEFGVDLARRSDELNKSIRTVKFPSRLNTYLR